METSKNFYCESCGVSFYFEDEDDIDTCFFLMPWPHIECPNCGAWIPLY